MPRKPEPQRRNSSLRQHDRVWQIADPQQNPLMFLDELCMESVLPPGDRLFEPDSRDIWTSRELFAKASQEGRIKTQKGVVNLKDLPETDYPEVILQLCNVYYFLFYCDSEHNRN